MNDPTDVSVWVVVAVAVLAVVALYLRGLVGRLDRLHLRVEAARQALDAQLLRRASAVMDLASAPGLDPASAYILVEAATSAQEAGEPQREAAESALSEDLRAVLDAPGVLEALQSDPGGREQLAAVEAACERVALARRFHNDAVRMTHQVRRRGVVRLLHLAGHAALPRSFEFDDAPPVALSGTGNSRP